MQGLVWLHLTHLGEQLVPCSGGGVHTQWQSRNIQLSVFWLQCYLGFKCPASPTESPLFCIYLLTFCSAGAYAQGSQTSQVST